MDAGCRLRCSGHSPSRCPASRRPPSPERSRSASSRARWTGAATTSRTRRWGQAGTPVPRVAPAALRRRRGALAGGPERPLRLATASSTTPARTSSRERGVTPVGLGVGPVPRPHLRPARGRRPRRRRSRSTPADPLEDVHATTSASISLQPRRRRRRAPATPTRASRSTRSAPTSTRSAVYGGTPSGSSGCARARSTATSPTTAPTLLLPRRLPPARDARGDAAGAPDDGPSTAGCGRTRPTRVVAGDVRANENIAPHRHAHAVRPRAQPDRRRAARRPVAEQASSRSRGASSAPSSSTSPTASSCRPLGVRLPPYRGYRPRVDPTLSNEFATVGYRAHSMIHGEFELEADAGRYTPAELDALEAPGRRGRARRRRRARARGPAQRRVLQPGPRAGRSASARSCRRSAPSRSTTTTSRSTTRCAASCSRCPARTRPTRGASTDPARPAASRASSTSARSTSSAARDHGIAELQRAARGVRPGARSHRSPRSPARRPTVPGRPASTPNRSTTRTSSTSSRCSTSTATRSRPAPRRRGGRHRARPPHHRSPRGCAAIYGIGRQRRRVRRHGRRAARARHRVRRAAARDLAAAVRRRCATATASSTRNDPALSQIRRRYGINYRHTLAELSR